MAHALTAIALLLLAGCSAPPQRPQEASPCVEAEASYACQVERYRNVSAP